MRRSVIIVLGGVLVAGMAVVLVLGHLNVDEQYDNHHSIHGSHTETVFDPVRALGDLRQTVAEDPSHMVHCHMETHMIGHQAYAALGEAAYMYADPMCGGGYLHGVIEQAFRQNGTSQLETIVHDVCMGDMTESCLHGIGHGIREVVGDVHESLRWCDTVTTTHTDCYDGVFMDVFDTEGVVEAIEFTTEQALALCEAAPSSAQASCYFYLPRVLVSGSAEEIVALCSSDRVLPGFAACAQGSGVFFMKYVSGFSRETALSYCEAYEDGNFVALCQNGVLAYETYGGIMNTRWH